MVAGSNQSKKRTSQLRKPHVYIAIVAGLMLIVLLALRAEKQHSPVKVATAATSGTASSLTVPITTSSVPTTAPPPAATTSADAQAVQGWWTQHSGLATALLNDEIALEKDEFAPSMSVTLAANTTFASDISAAQSAPAIPDVTMEFDWTNLLSEEQAAHSAVNQWIYANTSSSGASWTQALDALHAASTWEGVLDQDDQILGVH
jgi:hypothetical protein